MNEQEYLLGIDVGSTTVKVAILDKVGAILYSEYRRHFAHIQETLAEVLRQASEKLGSVSVLPAITGSGGMSLAQAMKIPFVQEVIAVSESLDRRYPQTDVAIELGGEDAKILYLTGGRDQRMNGICAGGTGSFIDQMASLLGTDAAGLNEYARNYKQIYPIAARCGVFAKSDLQPLINEGAAKEDLAVSIFQAVVNQTISGLAQGRPIRGNVAFLGGPLHFMPELRKAFVRTLKVSIFQAVVNQTISGLAQGRPIRGNVAFLGGPLHFMPELRKAFVRTLKLTPEQTIVPENSHLFAAMGCVQYADANLPEQMTAYPLEQLSEMLEQGIHLEAEIKRLPPLFQSEEEYAEFVERHAYYKIKRADLATEAEIKRLPPLFQSEEEYAEFVERHAYYKIKRADLATASGKCYLGIDAGSTTTKLALINAHGDLLWSFYESNVGSPLNTVIKAMCGQPAQHGHQGDGTAAAADACGSQDHLCLLHRLRGTAPQGGPGPGRGRGGDHCPYGSGALL